MNSDASECRHPKSQFSGSKVIVSGQKMGTSLSSRHGHSFVQKHILGSQKRLLICSKKHILGGQKWVHFGVQKWAHFWVHKWAPNLKLVRRCTFLDPKWAHFWTQKWTHFWPPKKSFFSKATTFLERQKHLCLGPQYLLFADSCPFLGPQKCAYFEQKPISGNRRCPYILGPKPS